MIPAKCNFTRCDGYVVLEDAERLRQMAFRHFIAHFGYEKNSVAGNNSGNSRNGSYPKKIRTEHGEAVISIPRDRNG